jgi:hypothetical protein
MENKENIEINKNIDLKKLLSENILLALSPLLAYWFAYLYEIGYCIYFNIPSEFITLHLFKVFGISILIFIYAFCLITIFRLSLSNKILLKYIYCILMYPFIEIPFLINNPEMLIKLSFYISWAVSCVFLIILERINTPPKAEVIVDTINNQFLDTIKNKVEKGININEEDIQSLYKLFVTNKFNITTFKYNASVILVVCILFVYLSFSCFEMGYNSAAKQQTYLVVENIPQTVIVRIYNDNIIGISYDKYNKIIKNKVSIIKLSSDKTLNIDEKDIGLLKK